MTETQNTTFERKERHLVSHSVAALISTHGASFNNAPSNQPAFIFGVKENGLIAPISGGVEFGEPPEFAMDRELREELGDTYEIIKPRRHGNQPFARILHSRVNRSSFGEIFLFTSNLLGTELYKFEACATNAEEIISLIHLSPNDIADILENPEILFKKELNMPLFAWLLEHMATSDPYRASSSYLYNYGVEPIDGVPYSQVLAGQYGSQFINYNSIP